MTERLDKIESDISDINNALNRMATEFLRPLMQQAQANQQAIAGLAQMMAESAVERSEQNIRIDNLLSDARADRQQAERDRQEWRTKFDEMQIENARRFDAQLQITQAMLVELARVNSRLEILERAS